MSKLPYINKPAFLKMKFSDATGTTPLEVELLGVVTTFPTLSDPKIAPENVDYTPQGTYYGTYEGKDAITGKDEQSLEVDIVEDMVTANGIDLKTFLMKKVDPSDGTTSAVSTNTDGTVTILDKNGSDYTASIPEDRFTFNFKVLMLPQSGVVDQEYGIEYDKVEITRVEITPGETNKLTIYYINHERGTEITQADY